MIYSTKKLGTVAECDQVSNLATERKNDLLFEQTAAQRELASQDKSVVLDNVSLITINAQITGTQAAFDQLPDGQVKENMRGKLRRLNDRKENLEERLHKGGTTSMLDIELDAGLLEAQLTEIDAFLTAVSKRKGEL